MKKRTASLLKRSETKRGDPIATAAIAEARKRFPGICMNGICGTDSGWCDKQVLTAITALRRCEKTKKPTIGSYTLKHVLERAAGKYISNGATIVAAIHLGFTVERPSDYSADNPNVCIGVNWQDIRRLRA